VQVARAGGSNIVVKQGGEDVTVGHTIRATVKKNKVAMPYRKAEFVIYYDGRPVDKVDELAAVALLKGLIPKYDSQGNLSETGRTYKFTVGDEEMIAKKKDDVAVELKKYPKIQAKLLQMIQDGVEVEPQEQRDLESDMSEDAFEEMITKEAQALKKGKKTSTNDEAEETSWDSI
jgi:RecA/RadA recombinase